jgi:membrane protein YqaA with SNARE-associated domain
MRLRETLIAWGPLGIFGAAAIESLGVPNPGGTDALILLVTIARPESALLCAALAVGGSLAGGVVFHAIVSKSGEKLLERRTASGRGARLRAWFQRYGLASVFVCALVPMPVMPLKVVALCACALGVSRARYLGVMAAARIPRYAGLAYLGAQLGEESSAWLRTHLWHLGAAAAALLAGIYAVLYWSDRTRGAKIKDVGA